MQACLLHVAAAVSRPRLLLLSHFGSGFVSLLLLLQVCRINSNPFLPHWICKQAGERERERLEAQENGPVLMGNFKSCCFDHASFCVFICLSYLQSSRRRRRRRRNSCEVVMSFRSSEEAEMVFCSIVFQLMKMQ